MKPTNKDPFEELLCRTFAADSPPPEDIQQALLVHLEEKEKNSMNYPPIKRTPIIAAALCLALSVTALASWHFLSAASVADKVAPSLSEAFANEDATKLNAIRTQDGYIVSLLGITRGEALTESSNDLNDNSTYAVVAIARENGTPVDSASQPYFVSPLIQGLEAWKYNIASMGGAYSEFTEDGVLYRLIECDDIQLFADRNLYLCVTDTPFYENNAFITDDEGRLSENPAYEGLNVLFDLPLDASKADPEAAQAYIAALWPCKE
ncbi:MAG: hypothetical protein IJY52_07975 [Anaerotignum sp.]|nr:hypothetical protein [Anaerotignum sp.]